MTQIHLLVKHFLVVLFKQFTFDSDAKGLFTYREAPVLATQTEVIKQSNFSYTTGPSIQARNVYVEEYITHFVSALLLFNKLMRFRTTLAGQIVPYVSLNTCFAQAQRVGLVKCRPQIELIARYVQTHTNIDDQLRHITRSQFIDHPKPFVGVELPDAEEIKKLFKSPIQLVFPNSLQPRAERNHDDHELKRVKVEANDMIEDFVQLDMNSFPDSISEATEDIKEDPGKIKKKIANLVRYSHTQERHDKVLKLASHFPRDVLAPSYTEWINSDIVMTEGSVSKFRQRLSDIAKRQRHTQENHDSAKNIYDNFVSLGGKLALKHSFLTWFNSTII
jgi:hypothetical protein